MLEILRPGARLVSKNGKIAYRESSVYDKAFYSAGKPPCRRRQWPGSCCSRYDKLSYGLILQSQDMVSTGYQVSNF